MFKFFSTYKKEEDTESETESEDHPKKKHHHHNKEKKDDSEEKHVRKRHKPQEEKRRAPQPSVNVDDVTMKFDDVIKTPGVTKQKIEELFGVCWEDIKAFLERFNIKLKRVFVVYTRFLFTCLCTYCCIIVICLTSIIKLTYPVLFCKHAKFFRKRLSEKFKLLFVFEYF